MSECQVSSTSATISAAASALTACLAFWDAPPTGLGCDVSRKLALESVKSAARAALAKAGVA